jgi:DNA polymerase elongation subunit (family B)
MQSAELIEALSKTIMEFKWCQIDPATASKQELEAEIVRLNDLMYKYINMEQGVKIFINSVYGATGSPWFIFFNPDVAEAVTLQGQDLIKYSEKIINRYFLEFWHKDKKLHQLLNLNRVEKIDLPVVIYIDTDSNYVSFEEVLMKCDWTGTPKEFILKVYEIFLKDYLNKCFDIYSEKCGTENIQNFELENVCDSGIWLAKKKYVYNPIWKDPGINIESLTSITAKGVEIVQSSSSEYVRTMLKNLLKYILDKKRDFSVSEFTAILRKYKEEYKLKNIEEVCMSSAIGDYEKFVLQDKEKLVLEKGCPIHVRAAAIHNYTVNNSKHKRKYALIRSGEKVKYYHAKSTREEDNVFAFIAGSFPIEIAPPLDHDAQFNKSIVQPINRFVEAMGYSAISPKLASSTQLF